jgi:transcription initiation factor IIF auxiliary subunit
MLKPSGIIASAALHATAVACTPSLQVTIVLHHTFQEPRRDILAPPYELTEVGWGEFDITIQLHFTGVGR